MMKRTPVAILVATLLASPFVAHASTSPDVTMNEIIEVPSAGSDAVDVRITDHVPVTAVPAATSTSTSSGHHHHHHHFFEGVEGAFRAVGNRIRQNYGHLTNDRQMRVDGAREADVGEYQRVHGVSLATARAYVRQEYGPSGITPVGRSGTGTTTGTGTPARAGTGMTAGTGTTIRTTVHTSAPGASAKVGGKR